MKGHPKKHFLARKGGCLPPKDFSRLALGRLTVEVGDFIVVREESDPESFGTVLRIIGNAESIKSSFVYVRWFYKPKELFCTVPDEIGSHELFDSDNFQWVSVLAIEGKVKVVSFLEYFNMTDHVDTVYYSRALYSALMHTLDPPLEEWARACHCKKAINPDWHYIECAACFELYHQQCVGAKEAEGQWLCRNCKEK